MVARSGSVRQVPHQHWCGSSTGGCEREISSSRKTLQNKTLKCEYLNHFDCCAKYITYMIKLHQSTIWTEAVFLSMQTATRTGGFPGPLLDWPKVYKIRPQKCEFENRPSKSFSSSVFPSVLFLFAITRGRRCKKRFMEASIACFELTSALISMASLLM